MKIAFVPIDNRPVCYNLAVDIAEMDGDIELIIPPREWLGDLHKPAKADLIIGWLKNTNAESYVLSLDTIAYGGLIPSRRGINGEIKSLEEIRERLSPLKEVLKGKNVYAFSSIMRIPNNNCNDEEKSYWDDYGKKIFEYSYNLHKTGQIPPTDIPKEILDDYLNGRERNFQINKMYLDWQKEGIFNTLVFSKDDCAEFGLNVREAKELEQLGGTVKTGADEIPLALLSKAIKKEISIFPIFTEPDYKNRISNYEDVSIEKSVLGQIELGGFTIASSEKEADILLLVNNFIEKQGELVMGWESMPHKGKFFIPQNKPFAIADVRFANGADNDFVEQILEEVKLENFFGYSGWNTSANTLGSLLSAIKVKYKPKRYDEKAFKKLQMIRFLDDWAYQANVRKKISGTVDIEKEMKAYAIKISEFLDYYPSDIKYTFPWNRTFEIEVDVRNVL